MSSLGRPSLYTPKLAQEVVERISEGEGLKTICRDDHVPSAGTVLGWVRDDREGFSNRYAQATTLRTLLWAEEIIEIADDGTNDTYVDDNGNTKTNWDELGRSKLRVDTRKWLLARLIPHKYGERVDAEQRSASEIAAEIKAAVDEAFATVEPEPTE